MSEPKEAKYVIGNEQPEDLSKVHSRSVEKHTENPQESFSYVAISPVAGIRVPLDKDTLGGKRLEEVIEFLRSVGWAVSRATQGDADANV